MAEPLTPQLEVEVAYVLPELQCLRRVLLPAGSTAAGAIDAAHLTSAWQGEQGSHLPLARFGRLIAADTPLAEGDRVEILRPLFADPKDQRRERVRAIKKASARARFNP